MTHEPIDTIDFFISRLFYAYMRSWRRVLRGHVSAGTTASHPHREGRHRVRPGMIYILAVLFEEDGIIIKDIAARVRLKYSTMTGMLHRMEENGLLRLQKDAADQRATRVFLTEAGRSLRQPLNAAIRRQHDTVLRAIGAKKLRQTKRVLADMIAALKKAEAPLSLTE